MDELATLALFEPNEPPPPKKTAVATDDSEPDPTVVLEPYAELFHWTRANLISLCDRGLAGGTTRMAVAERLGYRLCSSCEMAVVLMKRGWR